MAEVELARDRSVFSRPRMIQIQKWHQGEDLVWRATNCTANASITQCLHNSPPFEAVPSDGLKQWAPRSAATTLLSNCGKTCGAGGRRSTRSRNSSRLSMDNHGRVQP